MDIETKLSIGPLSIFETETEPVAETENANLWPAKPRAESAAVV